MRKPKTMEETYTSCLADGSIHELREANTDKIASMIENAETNRSAASILAKVISRQAKEWMNVYTSSYEALRICTEALLKFDKVDITNHQCLFAFLCVKHPELELDWEFFEKVRTKRNGVHYYGQHISYDDWKAVELQFTLYISSLRKEIERKLKS